MNEKPPKMSDKELYNKIIDSLVDSEISEFSSPREYLNSQGQDFNSLMIGGLEIVNQWKNKTRLAGRRAQFEQIKNKIQGMWPQLALAPRENLKEKLVNIFAGDDKQLAMVYWHKLDDITDSDIENMLKEQNILDSFIELFNSIEDQSEEK
jgi:hypothetical protein